MVDAVRNVQTVTLKPAAIVVVKVFLLVMLVVRNDVKSVQVFGFVKVNTVTKFNVATVVMIQEESLLSL